MSYYNKYIYVALIIVGVLFYGFSLYNVYTVASQFQGEVIPLFQELSTMKFSFRVISVNSTKISSDAIRVSARVLINITWDKQIDVRGPVVSFEWMNKSLATIDIESFEKPVINKHLSLELTIDKNSVHEPLFLRILIRSSIGNIEMTRPLANSTAILKQASIGIRDVKIIRNGDRKILTFEIISNNHLEMPLKLNLLDQGKNVLRSKELENFTVSPPSDYKVYIDITGIEVNNIRYVQLLLFGEEIAVFELKW